MLARLSPSRVCLYGEVHLPGPTARLTQWLLHFGGGLPTHGPDTWQLLVKLVKQEYNSIHFELNMSDRILAER